MAQDGSMPTKPCEEADTDFCSKECTSPKFAEQFGKTCINPAMNRKLSNAQTIARLDMEAFEVVTRIGGGGID